ncbi:MAG: class I SAM-dependent methyltransferase [Acidimicrobiia bacterium]|nr:class I SAM-dependent methyltransferase [Acidimicrobiia bacterium]
MGDTRSEDYAAQLQRREGARWKRLLNVQAPYRWNLRRLDLGFALDVGCGIGRNLAGLDGVGVDHNSTAVELARQRGFTAFTTEDFVRSEYAVAERFDSILLAHVVEHMTGAEARELLANYLRYLRAGGRVVLIAPQEAGFRSDQTHVEFMDHSALRALLEANGLQVVREYSFPLVRAAGRFLRYNEFVSVGRAQL